jgi:hypothetical protein
MRPDKGEEEMRSPVVVQQLDRLHCIYIITIFSNSIES